MTVRTNFRRFQNVSTEELRQRAEAEGLAVLEHRVASGETDPYVLNALRSARIRAGLDPDTGSGELKRLYDIPLDELRAEALEQERQREAQQLDKWQTQNAITFVAMTPTYKKCQSNANVMIAELKARNLKGTVSDIQQIFNDLSKQGRLKLNPPVPQPTKIYSEDELRAMPLEQMKEALEKMHDSGVF